MSSSSPPQIYITAKARIEAERRLRLMDKISRALAAWYSLSLIVFSLISVADIVDIESIDIFILVASIAIFCLSLFLYGENFSNRAEDFRACYLKLQKLDKTHMPADEKLAEYADILDYFPNHTDADYDRMLFSSWKRGQKLTNSQGEIEITRAVIATVISRKVVFGMSILVIFFIPIAPMLLILSKSN